ncbi:IspD/TarI family cytidylyltransferase [Mycobacterium sp. MMS18-G62]
MTKPSRQDTVGVVLAAGIGARVGADGNKAYLPLAGRSMVSWSLESLTQVPDVTRTVLVFRCGERELAERTVTAELPGAAVEFVEGGDSRHASEFNMLRYLAADIEAGSIDVVLIHDAARPMAGPDMFVSALTVAREFGGAVPALPLADVVRLTPNGLQSAGSAAGLVRVQTPQAFQALPLLQAYRAAERERFEGTDTSSCVEKYTDLDVRTFGGQERNLKVTYAHDIAVAERLLTDARR